MTEEVKTTRVKPKPAEATPVKPVTVYVPAE
jgi:hypothetical protein